MARVQMINSEIVLSPTDLVGFLECGHLASLDRLAAVAGSIEVPHGGESDLALELLQRLGLAHEAAYLEDLRGEGLSIVEIDAEDLHSAVEATNVAMADGVDVVFQAAFLDGRWRGYADFLRRVEQPSDLGAWSYEPFDTKLARASKVGAVLQLADYAEHLSSIQGREPDRIHVVLGDRSIESFVSADVLPYLRRARQRLLEHIEADNETHSERCGHCSLCRWQPRCEAEWYDRDDLRLVARLGRAQADRLREVGIATTVELASAGDDDRPARVGEGPFAALRRQARLQVSARGEVDSIELLDPDEHPGGGFELLPEPSETDLFFDLEGDPHHQPRGLEYLWGLSDTTDAYRAWWGHDHAAERVAFEAVIDRFTAHCDANRSARIYHYANYEIAVLKRLSALHTSREAELDRLLRERRFVDLYKVVRGAVATSRPGYSIKELEHFYRPGRNTRVVSGLESVVEYHRWIAQGDQAVLDDIEAYNTDDCVSTRQLRDWLEARRAEAESTYRPIDRPPSTVADVDERDDGASAARRVEALFAQLTDGDPESLAESDRLIAYMLGFHRRENRAAWWQYFARLEMTPAQLHDDAEAIGGLEFVGEVGIMARSKIYRYGFDPEQSYKLRVGDKPLDPEPDGEKIRGAGEVVAIDPRSGTIDLKRGTARHAAALVPPGPPSIDLLEAAVAAVATGQTDRTALDALLERRPPLLIAGAESIVEGETPAERFVRLGRSLDHGTLGVQGPPGTGKTHHATELIIGLIADGKRVAVTANSHSVVLNLLERVLAGAGEGFAPEDVVKVGGAGFDAGTHIGASRDAAQRWGEGEGKVIGGTAWLFCREDMRSSVDVLVIEEAGQFSLANAVAASPCADSLVLIGDPAQLDQPIQAVHPPGVAVSVLGHFQGDDATLPTERGVFLDTTYRMHPALCSFVSALSYSGHLASAANVTDRSIDGVRAGLHWVPVDHVGNASSSRE
ncbi:MAG: TM0106 family RecB-like putative nuclease, partial [Acidobacteria bacterium]|nr:TM0106 family RecB-like putative nuclease [Acidobacteriota bacterium]